MGKFNVDYLALCGKACHSDRCICILEIWYGSTYIYMNE